MREIEYRFYNKKTKKIITGQCVIFEKKLYQTDGTIFVRLPKECVYAGQYTGLKDKNNKKIYEGDIILISGKVKAEVIYHLDGFKLKTICFQSEILSRFYSWHLCEVIGNICENPELLEITNA